MRIFAIVWVGVILGLMPVQAIWSRRKVQKLATRMQTSASTASGLILIGVITFVIEWISGRTGIQAAKSLPRSAVLSAWAGGAFLTCAIVRFAGMLLRKFLHQLPDEVIALLLPRSTREQLAFTGRLIDRRDCGRMCDSRLLPASTSQGWHYAGRALRHRQQGEVESATTPARFAIRA